MATVTTMAQSKSARRIFQLAPLALTVASVLSIPNALAVETQIKPVIEFQGHGFGIKDEQYGGELDKGVAGALKPSLAINLTGNHVATSLFVQNDAIWYDDAQREDKDFTKYNVKSSVQGFDKRLTVGVYANSDYRVRDSRNGVFSDVIVGNENLSKTSNQGATVQFKTLPGAAIATSLGVTYQKVDSKSPELEDSFSDFKNDTTNAFLSLGSARRQSAFFWQADASYTKTERDFYSDYVSKRYSATLGIPLYQNLSVIFRGSVEDMDNNSNFANEFRSYGVGFEYKFGKASRINITQNRSTSAFDIQDDIKNDYIGAEIFLAPTRRTSISYQLDRRYFGRSATLQGQYRLQYLSFKLSVRDDVQTLSAFDQIFEDLGVFVCPDGASDFTQCFRPPTNNYQPQTGESFQQFINTDLEFSEELVKRRSVSFTVGYNKNRLSLSALANRSEDKYLESARQNKRDNYSFNSSWILTKNASLLLNANYYDINYEFENRIDKDLSIEGGFKRALNSSSDIRLTLKRLSRDSTINSFDYSENRVSLSYIFRL